MATLWHHSIVLTPKNRARLAREHAGLSLGQAAKLLGIDRLEVERIELTDDAFAAAGVIRDHMAEIYAVNPEWLAGDRDRYDYAAVDGMRGAENLTPHDRDILAEFAAAMPRDNRSIAERIDGVRKTTAGTEDKQP